MLRAASYRRCFPDGSLAAGFDLFCCPDALAGRHVATSRYKTAASKTMPSELGSSKVSRSLRPSRESGARFAMLNDEWLRSGEKHTPFNDWLVGIKKSKPEPTEPPVQNGKWRFERGRLVCNHELPDLLPSQALASLRIECAADRWPNGVVATDFFFYLTPYLDLFPDQEPFEPHLVKAPFTLRLVADGSGRGTEASPFVQGGVFKMNACATEDAPNTAIFGITNTKDIMLAARTFAVGSDLTFTLVEDDIIPASVRLSVRLTGDRDFASLYERLQRSV